MKKLARYLVIAVLVVWVMTDPTGAAALVHSAITGILVRTACFGPTMTA